MRWTVLAIVGAALAGIGVVGLAQELGSGSDIWRKGNGGVALLVVGAFCVWHGLSGRVNGTRGKPLWPTFIWLAALLAVGVGLYVLAPALALLYAIVAGIVVRFSLLASWLDRE
jgi:hypothetical protein